MRAEFGKTVLVVNKYLPAPTVWVRDLFQASTASGIRS